MIFSCFNYYLSREYTIPVMLFSMIVLFIFIVWIIVIIGNMKLTKLILLKNFLLVVFTAVLVETFLHLHSKQSFACQDVSMGFVMVGSFGLFFIYSLIYLIIIFFVDKWRFR